MAAEEMRFHENPLGVAVEAETSSSIDPTVQTRHDALTDQARERHDALTAAIDRLEKALAAPAAQRAKLWSERVSEELALVREEIGAHVQSVEAAQGLFEEIVGEKPRLASRIAALKKEHAAMVELASALAGQLPGGNEADFGALRREAADLLAVLRAHRASEADLIYEAFWTDLGAGD